MDIIIGGGVTGLSYALFTSNKSLILEAEPEIGGYCKTTKRNGYVWDYSGHFFHFNDKDIESIITRSLPVNAIRKVDKHTKIKYKDILVDFPFQKNIHQLPKEEFIDCLYDLFTAPTADFSTFKEMLYCKFGKSIADKFLIPYNSKLYACDLDSLDKDAMGRFFPYAEKEDIIRNFKEKNNSSYNNTFDYPYNGAVEYINAIRNNINNCEIRTNTKIVKIDVESKMVVDSNGQKYHYDNLISTVPFPMLLSMCSMPPEDNIYSWNIVVVFNLGFDKKGQNTDTHWIYFPEEKYCFYRVGFYDNVLNMDKMSLYVELGFSKDAIIPMDTSLQRVLDDLKDAGIVHDEKLVDYECLVMNPAYVHINEKSTNHCQVMKAELKKQNIYSIGRYGSWTYCSIEDNIKEARGLANSIIGK